MTSDNNDDGCGYVSRGCRKRNRPIRAPLCTVSPRQAASCSLPMGRLKVKRLGAFEGWPALPRRKDHGHPRPASDPDPAREAQRECPPREPRRALLPVAVGRVDTARLPVARG
jgi:hypothetical protein